jgi:putative sigma-54 modulation protein
MTEDADVEIEFKGRHDHITERMQAHAAGKLGKLARYRDRLSRIEVVANHAHKNPEVELIVHQRRGNPLIAKGKSTSFSSTIDLLVDKMEAQLRRLIDKRKDHNAGPAARRAARRAESRSRSGAGKTDADDE